MVEAPEKIWATSAMTMDGQKWVDDEGAEYLRADIAERQIAELRAELINRVNYWSELYSKEYHRAEAAEAENARLSEANRKLHRRAQGAEGLLQNASNVAREQIETLESVATKAGHWPAGSHWAKQAMERWLESTLSDSGQPALPLKDEVREVPTRHEDGPNRYHLTEPAVTINGKTFGEGWLLISEEEYAALRAGEQEGWRPMDSAPKDGKHVLLCVQSNEFFYAVEGAYCHPEGWLAAFCEKPVEPVYWAQKPAGFTLPASPSVSEGESRS